MAQTDLTPLSASEQDELREALAGTGAPGTEAISLGGAQEAFCDSWPMIKKALKLLAPFLPERVRAAIPKVIEWGDSIFETACPKKDQ